jgi:hypothetical protein
MEVKQYTRRKMGETFIDWLRSHGARFASGRVQDFGNPKAEYRAARTAVAMFDGSGLGRLRMGGPDALSVLHRTTTADLKNLAPGQGAMTVIQTETARILDWVSVWVLEDHVLVVTAPGRAEEDCAWIDARIIMDDAQVADVTKETELVELVGPRAPDVVTEILGFSAAGLLPHHTARTTLEGSSVVVARGMATSLPRYWLLASTQQISAVADWLVERGKAQPAGQEVSEVLRVEQGIPAVGRELTEGTNPLEAGLRDSIGFQKGCYTGQEVIARMITYDSVRRALVGLELAEPVAAPKERASYPVLAAPPDSAPTPAGTSAGRVTSIVRSLGRDQTIGLGIIKKELAEPGLRVEIAAGPRRIRGSVTGLPMVP